MPCLDCCEQTIAKVCMSNAISSSARVVARMLQTMANENSQLNCSIPKFEATRSFGFTDNSHHIFNRVCDGAFRTLRGHVNQTYMRMDRLELRLHLPHTGSVFTVFRTIRSEYLSRARRRFDLISNFHTDFFLQFQSILFFFLPGSWENCCWIV